MKRTSALILALLMLLLFASCAKKQEGETPLPEGNAPDETTAPEEPDYDNPLFRFGLAVYVVSNDGVYKFGYIDKSGTPVIEAVYDRAAPFAKNGLARVVKDGKAGFIDSSGAFVIELKYDGLSVDFTSGLALAWVDKKVGFIDTSGKMIIEPQFDEAKSFSENGLAAVRTGEQWGYIDTSGKYVIEPSFIDAYPFDEDGTAEVMIKTGEETEWHTINAAGEYVDDPEYVFKHRIGFHCGLEPFIYLRSKKPYGYWDKDKNIVLQPQFDLAKPFAENGLAAVMIDEKWGYIDTSGSFVIEPQFDEARSFNEFGLATVAVEGKYGVIDESGKYVVEPNYKAIFGFAKNGLAAFWIKTDKLSCGYLNTKGEIAIEPIFSYLSPGSTFYDDGYAVAWTEDGCGVIDATGSFLFEPSNDYYGFGE